MSSYFHRAQNFSINEAHFNDVTVRNGISVPQLLYQFVAHGASHDSKDQYDTDKCDPATRIQLLSDILDWIKVDEKETGVMLMHGPAGAGKSCIARSVCEKAASEGLLGASFFFCRGSPDRNNATKLVTTLAYQLSMADTELGKYIWDVVERNPQVIDAPLEIQFQKLILEPCRDISQVRKLTVRVIIIDGLDECVDEISQVAILDLLAKAVRYEGFPLGIFITSRPELHLQEVLNTKYVIFATQIISLNHIPGVSQDIRTVLQSGFSRILNEPRFRMALRSVPRPWPSPDSIDKLVQRSSKQFIYAATALKFISSPDYNPASQLEIVLGIRDGNRNYTPLEELDLLYLRIMSRARDPERTLKVLGFFLAIKNPSRKRPYEGAFSSSMRDEMLKNQNRLLCVIEQLIGLPDGEAYFALNQLHSLISLNVGSSSFRRTLKIEFYHKSFYDFLLKKSRSKSFFVDLKAVHFDMAQSCLRIMAREKCETEGHHVGWLYSVVHWNIHLFMSRRKIDLQEHHLSLQNFFTCSTCLSSSHIKSALNMFGVSTNIALVRSLQTTGKLSPSNLFDTALCAHCILLHGAGTKDNSDYFEKTVLFPILLCYMQSLEADLLTKQMLVSSAILTLYSQHDNYIRRLTDLWAQWTRHDGSMPDLHSYTNTFVHISNASRYQSTFLTRFLCSVEYSGPFYCTPDDLATAYILIIPSVEWTAPLTREVLIAQWMYAISGHAGLPTPTPTIGLFECLTAAAKSYYDVTRFNRELQHYLEVKLINWLQQLDNPPADIIELWKRAFMKARDSTLEGRQGYINYLCNSSLKCATCDSYSNSRHGTNT